MKRAVKHFTVIGFLLLLANFSIGQDSIHFINIADSSFWSLIKKGNRPALIYFTGTGCSLCKKMEKNVFTKEQVYSLYNSSFINLESYSDSKKPNATIENLRKRYDIVSNPSFVFISSTGDVIHKGRYGNEQEFTQLAKQALSGNNYATWQLLFQKGEYPIDVVTNYLTVEASPAVYSENNYECKAQRVLDSHFLSVPENEWLSEANWNIIKKHVYNPHSQVFKFVAQHQADYSKKYGQKVVDKKFFEVYDNHCSGDMGTERYRQALKEVQSSTNEQAKKWAYIKHMNQSAKEIIANGRSWEGFIAQNNAFIIANPHLVNAYQISNDWVENICKSSKGNLTAIKTANEWMKGILGDDNNQDAYYYEAYAKTFYLLKDKPNAIVNIQKAISLAKATNEDKDDILAMEKKLMLYSN